MNRSEDKDVKRSPKSFTATARTGQDVKAMYEQYPFPSPRVSDSLILDVATAFAFLFPGRDFAGARFLDAGCGTGHRLVALASSYPGASFTGIDLTGASLKVAAQLVEEHRAANVTLLQDDLMDLKLTGEFDVIISTGVIHHLSDPLRGARNLSGRLADAGLMFVWLYHPFGEFRRLLERELVLLLASETESLEEGLAMLEQLKVSLSATQYGTFTSRLPDHSTLQASIDVDAYLHPIVNAYRFHEAANLLDEAGLDWVAINGFNAEGVSRLIALDEDAVDPDEQPFLASAAVIFQGNEMLMSRYRRLDKADQLRTIELATRPTGFSLLTGRGQSAGGCNQRVRANRLRLER